MSFSWEPKVTYKAHVELSQLSEKLGNWQQATESHQFILEHPEKYEVGKSVTVAELFVKGDIVNVSGTSKGCSASKRSDSSGGAAIISSKSSPSPSACSRGETR